MPQLETPTARGTTNPPGDFRKLAVEKLKANGKTTTRTRLAVIEVLAATRKAMNAYDIVSAIVGQGEQIHSNTVYDVLRALEECGLLYRLTLPGAVFPRRLENGVVTLDLDSHRCSEIQSAPGLEAAMKQTAALAGIDPHEFRIEIIRGAA